MLDIGPIGSAKRRGRNGTMRKVRGACDEAELSLGWTGHGRGHPEMAMRGYDDDREHDNERELDCDREPEKYW